jgi:hypothetical protein
MRSQPHASTTAPLCDCDEVPSQRANVMGYMNEQPREVERGAPRAQPSRGGPRGAGAGTRALAR